MRRHNVDVLLIVEVVDQLSNTLGLDCLEALAKQDLVLILKLSPGVNLLAEDFDCNCALCQ